MNRVTKVTELEKLGQFDAEIEKSGRKKLTVSPRTARRGPAVFTFTQSDDGATIFWADKAGREAGGEASLIMLSCAKMKERGVVLLLFPETELSVRPIAFAERFLRIVVEWAAQFQGVSCWSLSPDYFDYCSPGFKMTGGEWVKCFFALNNQHQLLCFNSTMDKAPAAVVDVTLFSAVTLLGKEDKYVVLQLSQKDGSKPRLMAVENKGLADEWKKHLTLKLRSSLRSAAPVTAEVVSFPAVEEDSDDDEMEVPDLGRSDVNWGDPDHVSEIEIGSESMTSPAAIMRSQSLPAVKRNNISPRVTMGRK